ncbi:hypothetical protein AeMF1_006462, partial [Aphanomyces euteiches]
MKPDGRRMLKSVDKWTDEEVLKYYRLTNDYRMVNARAIPKAGTMPFQSTITQNLRGKKAMGTFNMPKCFWQFALDPTGQDMLSFMLNGWVMTPNRVMQGHVDSALYVQSTSEACYAPLINKQLLVGIDDILVYANDPEEYTKVLDQFFDLVSQYGFKLCPTKTKLYTKQVKWCGRYLSESGVKQDPERIQALC